MSGFDSLLTAYEANSPCGISRDEILEFARNVPPMPEAMTRLMRYADDPNSSIDQITEIVTKDPGLVSTLLKLANSVSFAQRRGVVTIPHALGVIGIANLKNLVAAKIVVGLNPCQTESDRMVRDHSLATALMLRSLSQRMGRHDADEIFLGGMLHRLGQFVFLSDQRTRKMFLAVLNRIRERSDDYVTAEVAEIGFPHTLIGALVANRWNFPAEVSHVLLHYQDPYEGVNDDLDRKTLMVKFASSAAMAAKLGTPVGYPDQLPVLRELGVQLGLFTPDNVEPGLELLLDGLRELFSNEGNCWPSC